MLVLSIVGLWAGFRKRSIECQLYFWILKSYQHGTRIGGERNSRPKHTTTWTWNAAEEFCLHLRSSTCMRLRLRASTRVCIRLRACICTQKIKCLDASRRKRSLRSAVLETGHQVMFSHYLKHAVTILIQRNQYMSYINYTVFLKLYLQY